MSKLREIEFVQMFDMARQEHVDVELRNFISNANVDDWRKIWVPEHFRLIGRILDRGDDILEHVESAKWN